jgi:glyoxylase-like metal-dependent hydrolase (beta-lactamase superfamily II)
MARLKIRPLSTGRFLQVEKSNFTYGLDQGVKIQSPVLMWFIEGARENILVDTGVSDPEWASRYHHPADREAHEEPLKAIQGLGLNPEDIDIIVGTHLHWDHCFNNDLFPKARILVQAEELRYAISPLPCHALFYESQLIRMTPPWIKALDRIEVVEGRIELEVGISLVPLPGHTPGYQGVLVELDSGRCLIAGDTCPLFENWQGNEQFAHIPPGIHVDLRDCYDTLRKMESMADMVLPGHDMKVLEEELYQ